MCPIFDRVVRGEDTRSDHEYAYDVMVDAERAADVHHHAGKGDLVEIVVQDLAEWTAVICAAGLLAIDSIDCLIPKVGEPGQ